MNDLDAAAPISPLRQRPDRRHDHAPFLVRDEAQLASRHWAARHLTRTLARHGHGRRAGICLMELDEFDAGGIAAEAISVHCCRRSASCAGSRDVSSRDRGWIIRTLRPAGAEWSFFVQESVRGDIKNGQIAPKALPPNRAVSIGPHDGQTRERQTPRCSARRRGQPARGKRHRPMCMKGNTAVRTCCSSPHTHVCGSASACSKMR